MEPEIVEFLKRIIQSLSLVLLWMAINSTAGIMYGLGFGNPDLVLKNYLFYGWLLGSLFFLVRFLMKKWAQNQ